MYDNLINNLDDGTFTNEILKQIANHFYFNDDKQHENTENLVFNNINI